MQREVLGRGGLPHRLQINQRNRVLWVALLATLLLAVSIAPAFADTRTISVTDGSVADWAGAPFLSDPVPDVNGTGQYEFCKVWMAVDADYLYFRWDIQLVGNNTSITSAAYGVALDTVAPVDGVADAFVWVSFDSKGIPSVSIEKPLGTLNPLTPYANYAQQINTGATNAIASIEARFPLTTLGLTPANTVALWAESHPSPSYSSNVKDRCPDQSGSYLTMDLSTGSIAPHGTGALVSVEESSSATQAGTGSTVTYTIELSNFGDSSATITEIVDNLPAGFTYVPGSTTGLSTAEPTASNGGLTLAWSPNITLGVGESATLSFSATASASIGTYYNTATVTYQREDGSTSSSPTGETAPVTTYLNHAPSLGEITDQSNSEADLINGPAASASDPDGDTITYSASGLPSGLSIDQSSGLISGTLTYSSSGTHNVTIRATDAGGLFAESSFIWTVTDVNRAPVAAPAASQTINEGETPAAVSATDADGDALTFATASTLPEGLSLNADGTFSGTASYASAGSYTIDVTVSDGKGGTASQTLELTINDVVVNRAPEFTSGASQIINEGETPAAVSATDADGDALTFATASTLPEGLSLNADGTFSGTTSLASAGSYTIDVTVSDGKGGTDTQTLTLVVNNKDTLPTLAAVADQSSDEGAVISLTVSGADVDGDTLTYSATGLPAGLSINSSTGEINGTLSYSSAGWYTVEVTVSDPGGNQAKHSFIWAVTDVNRAPVILQGTVVDVTMDEDGNPAPFSLILSATDADGDDITWSVSEAAHGSVSVSNGEITYVPDADFCGTDSFTVTVSDVYGASSSLTANVTVTAVNDAPSFTKGPDKVVGENTGARSYAGWATNLVAGPGGEAGQTLSFAVEADNTGLFSVQPTVSADGTLTFTPKADTFGSTEVTVFICDDGGTGHGGIDRSAAQTFTITVVSSEELVIRGTINNADTETAPAKIEGATVRLLDLSGRELRVTSSNADGQYELVHLVAGRYVVEVTHPSFSTNSRMTEVSFSQNEAGEITEDFLMADFTLQLVADPSAILGDGVDKSLLTVTVIDKNGQAIPGVELQFQAEAGSFDGGAAIVTTDADGIARIQYISADLRGSVNALTVPVTVTVSDPVRKLYGSDRIFVTFAPGFFEGVVTDGNNGGAPVQGATVTVYKDFDGDGITDFSFTQTTGPDGKYKVAIPVGGVVYDICIVKPVQIGNSTQPIEVHQNGSAGAITGTGDQFVSESTATGIVVMQTPDGGASVVTDFAASKIKLAIISQSGDIQDIGSTIDPVTGSFSAGGLTAGTYQIVATYDLGNGQEIIAGTTSVTIREDGEVSISQVLIDPFGIITDRNSGLAVANVKVELYYKDTGTLVPLPTLIGFEPAENANPQYSDANGRYAFMVFPDTDYYLVARKAGYYNYVSPTISVGKEIVKYDIVMIPLDPVPPVIEPPVEPSLTEVDMALNLESDTQEYYEESLVTLTVSYLNKSEVAAGDVQIVVHIPAYLSVVEAGNAALEGDRAIWKVGEVPAAGTGTVTLQLRVERLDASPTPAELTGEISGAYQALKPVDDKAMVSILLVTNRFGIGHHEAYMAGYPNGEFRPLNNITRAEIAAIFCRIGQLGHLATGEVQYGDVPTSHWARGVIEAVSKQGIFHGYSDGGFHPNQGITRAELAVVICNYLGLTQSVPVELHFADISTHWARNAIEALYRNKIIVDLPGGVFRPNEKITRADAVSMINGLLKRGPLSVTAPSWPDVDIANPYCGQIEESSRDHYFIYNADGSETIVDKP